MHPEAHSVDPPEGRWAVWRGVAAAAASLYALVVIGVVLGTAAVSPQPLQSNIRFWRGSAHVFLLARGGPLDLAGVRPGDDILALDGKAFSSGVELADAWRRHRPGEKAVWTVRRRGTVLDLGLTVRRGLDAFGLATVGLTILVLLGVGMGTYWLKRRSAATWLFLLFCISNSLNDASTLVSLSGTTWNQRLMTFAYTLTSFFGPALLLHLFLVFPERGALQRRLSALLPVVYGSAAALGLAYYLPTVAPGLTDILAAPWLHHTLSTGFDVTVVLAYGASALSLFRVSRSSADPRARNQARFLFVGLVALLVLQAGVWEIPLRIRDVSLVPLQAQTVLDLIVPLFVSATIVRHRLFDINILRRFELVRGLAAAAAGTGLVAVVAALGWQVHRARPELDLLVIAGAAAAGALAFPPLHRRLQEVVDRRLYSHRYSYRTAVTEISDRLAGILEPAAAARFIRGRVEALLEPSWCEMLVRAGGGRRWLRLGEEGFEELPWVGAPGLEELEGALASSGGPWTPEDLELPEGRPVQLVAPIPESGEVVGALLLGSKALEAPYLPEDVDLLATLMRMAGVVLRRGWLMEEHALRERLAAVGSATSALAHELKNPVAAVKSSAAVLRRRLGGDPRGAELTVVIEEEMDRLERVIGDVLSYVRPGAANLAEVDLEVLVRQLARLMASELEHAGVTVRISVDPSTPRLLADSERLRRAVMNLLLNARQAMPTGGTVEVRLEPWRSEEGRELGATLTVLDSGTGFSEESLRRGFEAFYTTKRLGTGLGLANVRRIAEEQGGRVVLANRPEGGAEVTVFLGRRPSAVDGGAGP